MGGSGGVGRSAPREDRGRSRLRLRKEFRAELSAVGSLSGSAIAGLSSGGGNVEKIFSRTHVGERRKRRFCRGPALRKSCRSHRLDSQGCAHLANARRKSGRRGSAGG